MRDLWDDLVGNNTSITITENYILSRKDCDVYADASNNAITIILPGTREIAGKEFSFKKIDNTANTVTIQPKYASETIDLAANLVIGVPLISFQIKSDGSNWWIR